MSGGVPGDAAVVRAAGGVVRRAGGTDGGFEVLVVHRPRYDDWSFPKGKAIGDETDEDCARREVEEETGLRCRLLESLASVAYVDRRGRPKVVRYWLMEADGGTFVPGDEVDEIRWLTPEEAATVLSYEHDRDLAAAVAGREP